MVPILLGALALAALAFVYSRSRPPVYRATASLAALPTSSGNSVINNTLVSAPALPAGVVGRALRSPDVTRDGVKRLRASVPDSAARRQTLANIAAELRSENYRTIGLAAEIDQNLIGTYEISALAGTPEVARATADAFTAALLQWNRARALDGINRARTNLITQRDLLGGQLSAGGQAVGERTLEQMRSEVVQQLQQVEVLRQTVSGTLFPIASAALPVDPVAPKPLRNAILTFGAALFFGVLLALPLLLPLMAVVAAVVYFNSGRPVLFWQERVGQDGQAFQLVKFRTMTRDSERSGPAFAKSGDQRVTPVGAFLRKFRLDELPQFWNVLRGEMSIIGPRPEQWAFVAEFEESIPLYTTRHWVRPGITGWAQVNQGYTDSVGQTTEKLQYDFFYVKHCSLSLDALIVWKTIQTILTGFGSR